MRELFGFFLLLCIALGLGIIVGSRRPPAIEPTAAVIRLPESPKMTTMVTREEMGIHNPVEEEPEIELSLEETIRMADECRVCSLNKLKGKTVNWTFTNLGIASTGSFYVAHYGMWEIDIFVKNTATHTLGDCVPDLNGNGHWRVKATLDDFSPGRIQLGDAQLIEQEAPEPVAKEPTPAAVQTLTEDDMAQIDFSRVEGDITTIIRSP